MNRVKGIQAALLAATFVASTTVSGGSAAAMGFSFGGDDSVGITFGNDDEDRHSDDHGDFGRFSIDIGGDTHIGDDATPSSKMTQQEKDQKALKDMRTSHAFQLDNHIDDLIRDFVKSLGLPRPTRIKSRTACTEAVKLTFQKQELQAQLDYMEKYGKGAVKQSTLYKKTSDELDKTDADLKHWTAVCKAGYQS
jgi:hypothetical protein